MARVINTMLERLAGNLAVRIKAGPNCGLKWSLTTVGKCYMSGAFEAGKLKLIEGMVGPGECFWDIGAHKGYVSLYASRVVGASGRVYALEPCDQNRWFLKRHLKWNHVDNVELIPTAVADRDGQELFGGRSSQVLHLGGGNELVQVRSIASLIANDALEVPSFVKIDVEGAELRVLQGAGDMLYASDRALLVSIHSKENLGVCSAILRDCGYRVIESREIDEMRERDWVGPGDPDILALGPDRHVSDEVLEAFAGRENAACPA